jgi:hypothetical protein
VVKNKTMKKIVLFVTFLFFILACQDKKDVCTCMKEIAREKSKSGFDPMKTQIYPTGCQHLESQTEDQLLDAIDDVCQQQILSILYGNSQ